MERAIIAVILMFAITGCATTKKEVEPDSLSLYQQKVLEEDQRTDEILAKAAALSAKSLAVFVRTEQAVHQKDLSADQIRQARFQYGYTPVGMEQKIELPWDGAPEPLLAALAANAGYTLIYMNERPPIPKSVTVSSSTRPIIDYIHIIEQQTDGYIKDIIPDDKSAEKTLRVVYADF